MQKHFQKNDAKSCHYGWWDLRPLDRHEVPSRQFFHSTKGSEVPYEDQLKVRSKYPKKLLVYQVLDSDGDFSEPFITDTTMDSNMNLVKCIKGVLEPFIHKYHSPQSVIFWPDMASCHHAKWWQPTSSRKTWILSLVMETFLIFLNVVPLKDFGQIVKEDIQTKREQQQDWLDSRGCGKESSLK